MTPTVVVPIRAFAGMERLAALLDERRRAVLGRNLAARAVAAAVGAGCSVVVVTGDPEVAGWARAHGSTVITDTGEGLDAAALAGTAVAADRPWAVVHGDLPFIRSSDVAALFAGSLPAIAPSKDGGTSAIAGIGPFRFRYGPASFHRHLAETAGMARVVVRRGLAIDVDSPRDVAAIGASLLDIRDTGGT